MRNGLVYSPRDYIDRRNLIRHDSIVSYRIGLTTELSPRGRTILSCSSFTSKLEINRCYFVVSDTTTVVKVRFREFLQFCQQLNLRRDLFHSILSLARRCLLG